MGRAPSPDQARCHTSDYANQARSLVDKFIKGQDSSRVLSATPDMDSDVVSKEKKWIQAERDELEEDRRNLAEAALKLGRERAALEVQRLEFLEDRRAWDVKKMIDDLPPSPKATGSFASADTKSALKLKKKLASPSLRKSKSPMKPQPVKQKRRSSIAVAGKKGRKSVKFSSPPPKKAAPTQTLDTELIPPSPPPPSRETIARMTSVEDLLASCSQPKELVTTEFVLPPRSPQSSLPPPPKPTSRAAPPPFHLSVPSTTADFSISEHVPQPSTSGTQQLPLMSPGRAFPVAKPLAQRMLHAYSPVKPSPLSRVHTVDRASPPREPPFISAGNPEDPFDSTAMDTSAERRAPLATLMEEDWAKPLEDLGKGKEKEMTLEEELGISMEVDPDPPLKARNTPTSPRKAKPSTTKKAAAATSATLKAKPKVEVKKPPTTATTRDKGKTKDAPQEKVPAKPTTRTRTAMAAGLDKENTITKRQKLNPPTSPTKPSSSAGTRGTTSNKPTTKPPPPRTRPRPGVTGATTSSAARSAATTTTTRAGARRVVAPPSKR